MNILTRVAVASGWRGAIVAFTSISILATGVPAFSQEPKLAAPAVPQPPSVPRQLTPPQTQAVPQTPSLPQNSEAPRPPASPQIQSDWVEFVHRADDFIAAFDSADGAKLLALFAEDSEYVDEAGNLYLGKEEISSLLTGFFANYPNAKLTIDVDSVRQLGKSKVVIEEGNRTITVPGDEAWTASYQYMVVYTLVDGQWLIASIREFAETTSVTPHDQLQPLAWLVGSWVNEGIDASVKIDFQWSDDGNYLLGEYESSRDGEVIRKATHRIGWNPLLGQMQSWIFDTEGGFGGGLWALSDDSWILKINSVLPDGETSSATLQWTLESPDRFKVLGRDRVIGEELDEDFEVVVSRKANVTVEPK